MHNSLYTKIRNKGTMTPSCNCLVNHKCSLTSVVLAQLVLHRLYVTQYNKRDMSTFENIEILALSNRRFYKLSNDTKFIKIEVIFLKIQASQCVNFLLFSLYFAHYFAHYLRMNLTDIMSLLLYWVTYCLE